MRGALAAGLAALASATLAQVPATDREAAERRTELAQTRRMVDAIRTIRREYVDVLEEGPLADRCADGLRGWLADRSMALAPSDSPPLLPIDQIGDLTRRVGRQYSGIDFEKMADACLKPMVEGLDRLSGYLNADSFRELQVGSGGLGGIGLELDILGRHTRILSAFENTPASRSDLQRGDLILSIDGIPTGGVALADVVKLMRGKPGSTIVLEISRPGAAGTLRRELTREIIRIQSVRSRLMDDGLLYVRLSQFQDATFENFVKALRSLDGKDLTGIVLDLRNNPGGLLTSCVAVAAVFLRETEVVVEMRGRTPMNQRKLLARPENDRFRNTSLNSLPYAVRGAPLAVLVNRRSAACSEILAAALQDHKRAKIVGEKTYGIGTVQTILPMEGRSAMKLTTSRYYRPNGAPMEANPVTPDVALDQGDALIDFGSAADPGLPAARKLLLGK
jgi:carboxyl-terminal processing protease